MKNNNVRERDDITYRVAKASLEEADIRYEVVDAEENVDLVKKYGIMQAPTLVVVNENGVKKNSICFEYQGICKGTLEYNI